MKKSELIAWLENVPGDPEVIIATDEEGNDFNFLYEPDTTKYVLEEEHYGSRINVLHPDDEEDYVEQGATLHTGIVFWP